MVVVEEEEEEEEEEGRREEGVVRVEGGRSVRGKVGGIVGEGAGAGWEQE